MNQHPPVAGTILEGKKYHFRVIESIPARGKNARLCKVRMVDNRFDVYLAKFFRTAGVEEHRGMPGDLGSDDQREFKRFKKEPRFLKLFNHANIVRYIDEYEFMDSPHSNSTKCFYVMEYLVGHSLRQYIDSGFLPVEFSRIALQIASALRELHRRKVIHRDIHPGNVFLSNGIPQLIDFGCAVGGGITRRFDYGGQPTELAGQFHRAPEAVNPTAATLKSDIYSLGVTLLELAMMKIPSRTGRRNSRVWIEEEIKHLSRADAGLANLIAEMVRPVPETRPDIEAVYCRLKRFGVQERRDAHRSSPSPVSPDGRSNQDRPRPSVAPSYSAPAASQTDEDRRESGWQGFLFGILGAAVAGYALWKEFGWLAAELARRVRVVLLDIDNTLVHSTQPRESFVAVPPGDRYLADRTRKLLAELRETIPIILVTGRRAGRYHETKELLPHNYAIYENGAVILDPSRGILSWRGNDPEKLRKLSDAEERLREAGYPVEKTDRLASLRISKGMIADFEVVKLKKTLPQGVQLVFNGPFLDFVLEEAGKGNAASWVLELSGLSLQDAAFVGDDLNDTDLLERVGFPATFRNSPKTLIDLVRKKKGYVTRRQGHEGTAEVLERIKALAAKRS